MNKIVYRICLSVIVTSHHIGLWSIMMSVPLLIFNEPIWISLPLCAWIMHLSLSRVLDCPYTRLENYLRRKLGMKEITTFISHYYKKPYHRLMWAIERNNRGK